MGSTITVKLGPLEGSFPLSKMLRRFKSDLSMLLYGAQGTGKSSFIEALLHSPIGDIRELSKTQELEKKIVKYSHISNNDELELTIICSDCPGDKRTRKGFLKELVSTPPSVILLMLDHFDTRKKYRSDFANKMNAPDQQIRIWETNNLDVIGRADTKRISENADAIKDLHSSITQHKELKEACSLIVPVVTKLDLWESHHDKDFFYESYYKELALFRTANIDVSNVMSCSTIYNMENSIYKIMKLVDERTSENRAAWHKIKKWISKRR